MTYISAVSFESSVQAYQVKRRVPAQIEQDIIGILETLTIEDSAPGDWIRNRRRLKVLLKRYMRTERNKRHRAANAKRLIRILGAWLKAQMGYDLEAAMMEAPIHDCPAKEREALTLFDLLEKGNLTFEDVERLFSYVLEGPLSEAPPRIKDLFFDQFKDLISYSKTVNTHFSAYLPTSDSPYQRRDELSRIMISNSAFKVVVKKCRPKIAPDQFVPYIHTETPKRRVRRKFDAKGHPLYKRVKSQLSTYFLAILTLSTGLIQRKATRAEGAIQFLKGGAENLPLFGHAAGLLVCETIQQIINRMKENEIMCFAAQLQNDPEEAIAFAKLIAENLINYYQDTLSVDTYTPTELDRLVSVWTHQIFKDLAHNKVQADSHEALCDQLIHRIHRRAEKKVLSILTK